MSNTTALRSLSCSGLGRRVSPYNEWIGSPVASSFVSETFSSATPRIPCSGAKSKLPQALDHLGVIARGLLARPFDRDSVSHRAGDNRSYSSAQWSNIALSVRMHAIAQEDYKHLARRIDPDRRAGKTGMTKRTQRKQFATIGGVP